jgi:hypothetical protein
MDVAKAEAIFNQGKEAVVFALLQLAKMAAEASSCSVSPKVAQKWVEVK